MAVWFITCVNCVPNSGHMFLAVTPGGHCLVLLSRSGRRTECCAGALRGGGGPCCKEAVSVLLTPHSKRTWGDNLFSLPTAHPTSSRFFGYLFLFFDGTRVWIQGFVLARQALCCLSYTSNPDFLVFNYSFDLKICFTIQRQCWTYCIFL
jgi:hypothetical protein